MKPSLPTRSARHRPNSFTMVELMVTVVIIGIVSGITIVYSGNEWRRDKVNAVAIELAGWLEQVRNASLKNTDYRTTGFGGCSVSFTPNSGQTPGTTLAMATGTNCSPQGAFIIPGVISNSITYDTASVPSSGALIFTPRGSTITPSNTDYEVRILLNGSSYMRCVRVIASLGSIRIGRSETAKNTGDDCGSTYGGRF